MAERQVSQLASLTTQQHHHTGGARQPNTHKHAHTHNIPHDCCGVNTTSVVL